MASIEFSPELRPGVASGDITLTYRLWRRARVKVGGRYLTSGVEIEVDDVEVVPFSTVTGLDVERCGEVDVEALRNRTAHAGPVTDDTLVHRIEFHVVG